MKGKKDISSSPFIYTATIQHFVSFNLKTIKQFFRIFLQSQFPRPGSHGP